MSATKQGRGLASPDSRRRPLAKRARPQGTPLFDGDRTASRRSPAAGTHRVPDPQPATMLETQPDCRTAPETWWESVRRAEHARADRLEPLWRMTPAERVAAMRRGEPTYEQLSAWGRRHPEQVPVVHGEFEWIVAFLPEVCE